MRNTRCTKLSMVRDDSKSSKTSNKKCLIYMIVQLMSTDKLALLYNANSRGLDSKFQHANRTVQSHAHDVQYLQTIRIQLIYFIFYILYPQQSTL